MYARSNEWIHHLPFCALYKKRGLSQSKRLSTLIKSGREDGDDNDIYRYSIHNVLL
jgi:hypothetical protein